jgi:hypothetical protein
MVRETRQCFSPLAATRSAPLSLLLPLIRHSGNLAQALTLQLCLQLSPVGSIELFKFFYITCAKCILASGKSEWRLPASHPPLTRLLSARSTITITLYTQHKTIMPYIQHNVKKVVKEVTQCYNGGAIQLDRQQI